MKLKELLSKNRPVILKKWLEAALEASPADTADLFRKQGKSPANPAVPALSSGMAGIFNELLFEADPEKAYSCLYDIMRLRAVQDFTAAQAVSFVFLLKKIIKEELSKDIQKNQNSTIPSEELSEALDKLASKIDAIALISFDIYMECREKLYNIKANEMRNWTSRLVERANKIYEKRNSEYLASEAENETGMATEQKMTDK